MKKNERLPFLSVVMPAYNEEATIEQVARKVLDLPFVQELVIVDDCSDDGTARICTALAQESERIRYVRHERNQGKTEALKTGFALTSGEIVIIQDADLEYDPEEIADVVEPIVKGKADVVYGSRFIVKRATRVLYFYHYLANKALTFFSNLLTNLNMTDIETCYKAFRREIVKNLIITSEGFGFEVEVTAKVAKLRCAIYEVPISYYGRTYDEGKKIGLTDGLAALWYILRFNLFCSLKASFRETPQLPSKAAETLFKQPPAGTGISELL